MAVLHSAKGLPVLIVGAGFSGTLLAINLARNGSPAVLVERDETQLAKGLAFGTRRPEHLLNVRASNMSAFPDDPEHFMRWMGFSTADQAARFVPRLGYGRYLRELLVEALSAPERLVDVVVQDAVGARAERDGVTVRLGDGKSLRGRALVLALGNFPPQAHPVLARLPPQVHWANPWQAGAMEALRADDHILLLGTGLTAVDVVLSLETAGYCGRITALSRRGLRPRSHAAADPDLAPTWHPEERGSRLVRAIRRRAAQVGWRAAIDELRPCTQHLWRRHDSAEQRRLLRHARPYWDVHRHRLAPTVAARIDALAASGRLDFTAGKLAAATWDGRQATISWRPRGGETVQSVGVTRVINCTGPEGDLSRTADPLLQDLLHAGRARADAHRLGLDVDHLGRVRDAQGAAQERLFAAGPLTRGEAWEIVAVPDIRRQVWDMARYLSGAHWVGGEGL